MTEEPDSDDRRTMDAEEALRDTKYIPPSTAEQLWICLVNQMSLFFKQKTVWALLLMVLAIPFLYVVFHAEAPAYFPDVETADVYASYILAALPLASMFAASVVCGSMLPREYNERTVYLTLPMPVSRRTFFFGKFLSGYLLCASIACTAYGVALAISMTFAPQTYTGWIAASLATSLAGTFFCCAFAYMLSARMTRGSSVLPLILMFVAIPLACILAYMVAPGFLSVLGYAPVFSFDLSLDMLGDSMNLSLLGFLKSFLPEQTEGLQAGPDAFVMSAVSVVLGIAMLYVGCVINDRRDMR